MKEFRFQLGEVVTTKEGIAEAMMRCKGGCATSPKLVTITQRLTVECHAGVQHEYSCSMMGENRLINDSALASLSDFDLAAATKAVADAKAVERKVDHDWYKSL